MCSSTQHNLFALSASAFRRRHSRKDCRIGNDDAIRDRLEESRVKGRKTREVGRKGRWALSEKSFAALLRDVEDEGKHL